MSDKALPNFPSSSGTFSFCALGGVVILLSFIHCFIFKIFCKFVGILFLSISSIIAITSSNSGCFPLYSSFSSSVFNSAYGFINLLLISDNACPNFASSSGTVLFLFCPLGGFVVLLFSIQCFIFKIFFKYTLSIISILTSPFTYFLYNLISSATLLSYKIPGIFTIAICICSSVSSNSVANCFSFSSKYCKRYSSIPSFLSLVILNISVFCNNSFATVYLFSSIPNSSNLFNILFLTSISNGITPLAFS